LLAMWIPLDLPRAFPSGCFQSQVKATYTSKQTSELHSIHPPLSFSLVTSGGTG
jgi:hypothetical protein